MMKKVLSFGLALVMCLSLLPASVLTAAAEGAYQVLFEPQLEGPVSYAYDDTAAVWSVTDKVYRFVRFTGSGIETIPGEYANVYWMEAGYAAIRLEKNSSKSIVVDMNGKQLTAIIFSDSPDRPDNGLIYGYVSSFDGGADSGYYRVDLDSRKGSKITSDEYVNRKGYPKLQYSTTDQTTEYVDKDGKVLFGGYVQGNYFYNGYANVTVDRKSDLMIDPQGNVVLEIERQGKWLSDTYFYSVGQGLVQIGMEGSAYKNYVDLSGNILLPVQYNWLSSVSPNGLVWATSDKGMKVSILKIGAGSASAQPQQPVQPAGTQAMPTNDTLKVNGEIQNATVYKINDSNYFKIRDLAAVLNGTSKQFAVGYDADAKSVTATSGQGYDKLDGDLAGAAPSGQTAEISSDAIIVNGEKVDVEVYKIDGSNYFKLRDLGSALGFDVGWTAEEGMFINTEG